MSWSTNSPTSSVIDASSESRSSATSEPDELQLCELARMRVRYQGFPGGRDIQADCEKVLRKWGLDEAALFERTRQIHARGGVYQGRGKGEDSEWGTGGSAFDTAE